MSERSTHEAAAAPPRQPPSWLRRSVERMPGSVRLDHALMRSLETYFGEWDRLLPRAFVAYLPGGLVVLAAAQLFGVVTGAAVNLLVLFIGVVLLQPAEVMRVAGGSHHAAPYLRTLRAIRGRLAPLLVALVLAALMFLVPGTVFSVVATAVLLTSVHCTIGSDQLAACSVNLVPYFVLFAIFLLTLIPLGVRLIMIVPVVTLERRGAADGISRSWRMTQGEAGRLSLWFSGCVIVSTGIWLAAHTLFSRLLGDMPLTEFLASAAGDTLGGSLLIITLAQTYLHLLATPAQLPQPPPLAGESGTTSAAPRSRLPWRWLAAGSIVFVATAATFFVTGARSGNALGEGSVAPTAPPAPVDGTAVPLRASQMSGYTLQGTGPYAAYADSATYAGSAATSFSGVISAAQVEDDAQLSAAVDQGAIQGLLDIPGSARVNGLPAVGSGFAAIEYTQDNGDGAGAIVWVQGRVACLIVVTMSTANLPDMHAVLQLARREEANAVAAQR